jgi:RND family efflux transporter MFP subunit
VANTVLPARPVANAPPQPSATDTAAPGNEPSLVKPPAELPKRGKLWWALAVGLAFGAGWLLAGGSIGPRDTDELAPDTAAAPRDSSAVVVTVEPVTYRPVQRAIEGVGTLHGFEDISISARVEGRVRRLHFDVADRVKPGQLLLEIDPTDYELSVEQAERGLHVELAKLGLTEVPGPDFDPKQVPLALQGQARMDNAQAKYERTMGLAAKGAVSAEERGNASTDYLAAKAEYANKLLEVMAGLATIKMKQTGLAVARQQLKDTKIIVPTPTLAIPDAVDGVVYAVTHRAVAEGTLVRSGTEVGKLVLNQTLKLRVPIPERYGTEVRPGQKALVSTAAFPHPFGGTVTRVSPAVEPTTRTFEVEIQVPNPKGELKSGSFAKAAILTRLEAEAATVPLSALVSFAGITKVFLVEDGRAREVRVTLGIETTEWVEITQPALPRGAQVITSGQTVLAAQSPVVVRAATAEAMSQAPVNSR